MTPYQLFMPLNGEVTEKDIEQIIQSLITYGDAIWLPETYAVSPALSEEASTRFKRTLKELEEAALLKLWTLEGMGPGSEKRAALVIPIEGQEELRDQIDYSALPTVSNVNDSSPPTRDSASRLIEFRHELWHMGIASQCGTSAIVYSAENDGAQSRRGTNYDNIGKEYSRILFEEFEMPSLLGLGCMDILKLRDQISAYRSPLDTLLSETTETAIAEAKLVEDCRKRYGEYLELVGEAVHERAVLVDRDTIFHAGCHMAAVVLPVVGFLPFAAKFYQWLTTRHQQRFALYMHRVRQLANNERPPRPAH